MSCLLSQVLQKCFDYGMSIQMYRPDIIDVLPDHKTATHAIFISDTFIEAWSLDKEIQVNHSDWLGTIDNLDEYLQSLK